MNIVGSYELLARIAESNSAQRWRGRDTMLGRDVQLRQIGTGSTATIDAPRSGLRVLAGLSHPNIVGLLDKVEADGQLWLIDETADGITLEVVLGTGSWPTPPQALGIVRGVLKGLAYVHNSRAMHGDITPATVLLDAHGTARLTDFGLPASTGAAGADAKVSGADLQSPEAASGLGVSVRSDVYSVGALLALLLGDEVDVHLRPVLDKAMAKDPTERYLDAEELLEAIEDAAEAAYGEEWLAQASVVELVTSVVSD